MRKFKPFHAPKQFLFKDPDTGRTYKASTKQDLVDDIIAYRAQNELPAIPYLLDVLENYWCCLPENEGSCEPVSLHRSLTSYIRGGIALLENVFYGKRNMVRRNTAIERAGICLNCPLNSFPDRSGFITWSDNMAEAATGGAYEELPKDIRDNLGNCLGCSCTLKAKVFYKPDPKLTIEQQEYMRTYQPRCWQLPENWTLER